ncbi:hypothetical protein ACFPAF_06120 [Hymenobacter endophyticus]|uniref:Uncharacterized protein n=1 Tax=Hymenobacter endophyticus TaxID=3076335 RepID=A0ABU3TF37_9BACT|nr:hypothetical protein [Hymenobacter endophyticus]MDU0369959.1 hypothetical protein [Hymenobacter endophyticus]
MKKTFEDESDALSTSPATPTTNQSAATTPPSHENTAPTPPSAQTNSGNSGETPVPVAGNGAPDYSQVEVNTQPELPTPDKAGGSATEPESGGGYSG